ncbi:uronate isomerase [Bombiscardovia nodaiensis]|uniref:Uronate isomerase n=1 Tax=Bombiscardovia nodaiensis TaxID=2932181 RepID=A0ABM8B6R8_9BIFI|nr:uronate isomerase [Bombiscardovia nodaiensis]
MAFLDDDYLLGTKLSRELFHQVAEPLPLVDYHCHLHAQEIYEDPNFANIVEAWLTDGHNYGDHYKWRLERANGVPERLITGDGDPWEKFQAYAGTMEKAIGSPVYLWTHMELRRYFGITEPLTLQSARRIYDQTNEMLAGPDFSRRALLRRMNTDIVCTTDSPEDDLHYHELFAKEGESFHMIPAFRPDVALKPQSSEFAGWVSTMESVCGKSITSFADLVDALGQRIDYFHEHGSRLSDHAVDAVEFAPASEQELDAIMAKALAGQAVDAHEQAQYRAAMLLELMRLYSQKGWTMQLHLHAMRDVNSTGFAQRGADTGYDAIDDRPLAPQLARLLDAANSAGHLPKLLVYSLNPNDYMPIAATIGAFEGDSKQKLSLGNAWWFNDTRTGIRRQLQVVAETSLLGNFVGMTTDSRSFLSYPRHEFFRRILCELVGEWAQRGEVPDDLDYLSDLIRSVSYQNARDLFSAQA